ncbi:transglycosylase domain-containing protein [Chryseolinea lacunae]|uniref:Transglycosylase domain-containing protein n=1 Tax=Chryseolinea lacunae TaxID=2801331 RepID=A0ABS1KYA0_9BACT|nr:transglycosylase domain-containing protein [Chryseolinea lacunae]MBL0744349.1 transglycosylase domain-containing protein [Chryseolinea lacunae]
MKQSFFELLERLKVALGRVVNSSFRHQRAIRIALLAVAGLLALIFLFVGLVWIGLFGHVPNRTELRTIRHQVATEVYSADSVLLGRYYLQERSTVPSSAISDNLKNALIATEDARFYQHSGIDTRSLFRVFIKGILFQRESAGGGSTLTQQLAKNLYPRQSHAVFSLAANKVKEMIVARRLERVYSKDEILTLYLNTIPFGDNVYGIKTAAERFYSVPVNKLTTDQSAVLVGMLKATHTYNPRIFPERAKGRRDVVLEQMEKYGYLTEEEKTSLQKRPLKLQYQRLTHNSGLAPYFRSYIQNELLAWCQKHQKADGTPYNLYTDGLKVYTTIDSRMQRYAEQAMQLHMKILQKKFVAQVDKRSVKNAAAAKLKFMPRYVSQKREGLSEKEIMADWKKGGLRKVFTWDGEKEMDMSAYDSLVHHLQFLQAGILAVDPHSGAIKAWVGGIDHEFFQFDHVRETTKRQVGSTFKPIVYASAVEQGVSPCDYISARKTAYTNMEGWTPENSHDDTYDQKYSMEGGLAGSVNTVSVKLLEKAGIPNAIATARKMGITSELPAVPSIALGTPSISMLEMVGAYSVFANGGNHVEPTYLTAIAEGNGTVLEQFDVKPKPTRAVAKETADIMLHMLERVVNEGTGASLRSRYGLRNDIAGKTGTTQSNADGWFIGITPKLVIGCWVGADDPAIHFRSTSLGQGASTALPIVGGMLQQMNKDNTLRAVTTARFAPLSPEVAGKLDCSMARSDRNFFQRLFKTKKKTKRTTFRDR